MPADLVEVEVRPIAHDAGPGAEAAVQAWLQERQASADRICPGEAFSAAGYEFAVTTCRPLRGGVMSSKTERRLNCLPVPVLDRIQFTCLDIRGANPDQHADERAEEDALYKDFVQPYLISLRDRRRAQGGRYLAVFLLDQVVQAAGHEFGVRALDPAGRCGAMDENTSVFVAQIETQALAKVHVLPYEETLPAAYAYDLFNGFLRPFFQAHPFAVFGEGDIFTFNGVRFRVMATDPRGVAGRVGTQTLVFNEGEPLRPTVWELLPPELREDLRRLPPGLQTLLLNTMGNEEAIRGRLREVHDVLRRGQGLHVSELGSCGKRVIWSESDHAGSTQQQCMVCLAEFAEGDDLRQLSCDHLFHQDCIDEWLQRSAACPICKRAVSRRRSCNGPVVADGGVELVMGTSVVCSDGRQGTVQGFDADRQQFRITLAGRESQEQHLPADQIVQQLQGIRLAGLRQAEFNGEIARITGLDASRGRYQVRLESSGKVLSVRPDCCILPEGSVARVVGLRAGGSGARWNGHFGRVVSFDQERMRHTLAMQPRGQLLGVRLRNLRV